MTNIEINDRVLFLTDNGWTPGIVTRGNWGRKGHLVTMRTLDGRSAFVRLVSHVRVLY